MDAAEVEFLAEQELVTIIPNFSLDRIYLIGGDLGPFNPGLPVEVPLWLAISLKQRQKCRLMPPEWMDIEKLEQIREQERKEDTFTPMPSPYYMELTKLLLNYAADNIPKADEIRTLVKDTWDTRIAKLRLSADSFVRQQEAHARIVVCSEDIPDSWLQSMTLPQLLPSVRREADVYTAETFSYPDRTLREARWKLFSCTTCPLQG